MSLRNRKLNIFWFAVQPTPYNKFLYDSFKNHSDVDFKLFYERRKIEALPYEENYYDKEDVFLPNNILSKVKLIYTFVTTHDPVVFAGWNNFTKICIILLRGFLNKPYVIWTDSINPDKYQNKNFVTFIKKRILNLASLVFTTGKFGVGKLKEAQFITNTSKLLSLPFYVELPQNPNIRPQNSNHDINLLILAQLRSRKGVSVAIKAIYDLVKQGYNPMLKIGGTGPLHDELSQMIVDLDLLNNIELLGWLNREKLMEQRKEADLLLHPVIGHDPFPLVVLESLAHGMPVITTFKAGSGVERIKDGVNGFIVEAGDFKALSDRIKILILDQAVLSNMILAARESAELHQPEQAVEMVINAIKSKF